MTRSTDDAPSDAGAPEYEDREEYLMIKHIFEHDKWTEIERHAEDILTMVAHRATLLKYDPDGTLPWERDDGITVQMSAGDIECEMEAMGDRMYILTRLDYDPEAHRGPN